LCSLVKALGVPLWSLGVPLWSLRTSMSVLGVPLWSLLAPVSVQALGMVSSLGVPLWSLRAPVSVQAFWMMSAWVQGLELPLAIRVKGLAVALLPSSRSPGHS